MTDAWNASRAEVLSVIDRRIEEAKDYLEYIEVRPSSVRLNTENICDQAEQIDNLKAEMERLRGVLGSVQSAFPVLASMCRKIGLTLGEEKAKEMMQWIDEALNNKPEHLEHA